MSGVHGLLVMCVKAKFVVHSFAYTPRGKSGFQEYKQHLNFRSRSLIGFEIFSRVANYL